MRRETRNMKRQTSAGGFTLIELLVVISILMVLAAVVMPAVKSLGKSNDLSQAANLVRAELASARSIAMARHTQAGVVFFEETAQYSLPVNGGQTAMQIFVEDYSQRLPGYLLPGGVYPPDAGATVFVQYSSSRQYLPRGIMLAGLGSAPGSIDAPGSGIARAIVFDGDGNLITRSGMMTPPLNGGLTTPGSYPKAYGDWNFINAVTGIPSPSLWPSSVPGFYLFNGDDFRAVAPRLTVAQQAGWMRQNADVILVNANTGLLIDVKH